MVESVDILGYDMRSHRGVLQRGQRIVYRIGLGISDRRVAKI